MRIQPAFVVWFTGLPSSGKTTVSQIVQRRLRERGYAAECLDGDELRRWLSRDLGFSRADRAEHMARTAALAALLARNGIIVLAALVSPDREARARCRAELGRFVEVYVKCPRDICAARDVKGLYARASAGEIERFTGVSDPYEEPLCPEITLETDRQTPEESAATVLRWLEDRGWLPVPPRVGPSP